MAYVNVKQTIFNNTMKNIVAIPDHYVALTAVIKASNAITRDGKKVIPAGLCVSDALTARATGLTPTVDTAGKTFNGVIFNDEEVPAGYGNDDLVNVTVLVHGFVNKNQLVGSTGATITTATCNNDLIVVL